MSDTSRRILVWDLATRLFHWLTLTMVVAAYFTWRMDWMKWHAWTGDAVLALIFFRIVWGFVGSDSARFSHFVARPRVVASYLAHLLVRAPDRQVGHNPAGGWMVLLLLTLLLGQAISGILVNNEVAVNGPLGDLVTTPVANLVTDLHTILWDALLGAIALHVLAILVYALVKGQNLLLPMLTGYKVLPKEVSAPRAASATRALAVLAAGTGAAVALANFL